MPIVTCVLYVISVFILLSLDTINECNEMYDSELVISLLRNPGNYWHSENHVLSILGVDGVQTIIWFMFAHLRTIGMNRKPFAVVLRCVVPLFIHIRKSQKMQLYA